MYIFLPAWAEPQHRFGTLVSNASRNAVIIMWRFVATLRLTARPTRLCGQIVLRRRFSSEGFAEASTKATTITKKLEQSGETVGVAELASGGLISAILWTAPTAQRTFKGAGVRLAYGINREADIFGRENANNGHRYHRRGSSAQWNRPDTSGRVDALTSPEEKTFKNAMGFNAPDVD